MSDQQASRHRELLRQWVDTWRQAGGELDDIRRREIESADTQEAVRQLFGTGDLVDNPPPRTTSGLVEQQAWFARLRSANMHR
jgi:transposase-like protein